jgi:ABC-type enterochelin transport system permease subunit
MNTAHEKLTDVHRFRSVFTKVLNALQLAVTTIRYQRLGNIHTVARSVMKFQQEIPLLQK